MRYERIGFAAFVVGMVLCFAMLVTALTGCSINQPCQEYDIVTALGQCAYSKVGDWGDSECVALTAKGYKVKSEHPFVVGERACVRR